VSLIGPTLETLKSKIANLSFIIQAQHSGPTKTKPKSPWALTLYEMPIMGKKQMACYLWFILIFPLKVESCTVASPEFEVPNRACFP
jgi:hypothetical protein